ncbi:hypothetical protein DNP51_24985 [Salmonella enterica subsp. enterica serovar Panama]|uniref:LEPR-XLL domain-containing protein n=1 Tax=Salmonella potsdam TaxID=597 RepID=A0A5X0KNH3_SALPO|nr:LEPR-XLL domain-containing protein [Salmonella enterica]EBY7662463.1 LEPR-XLL domain-containing protein [Salmonella enterica subsp. enterica serovar Potsdam]TRR32977.1 hypothetical protein DNP51_24985 [Salmonella enterica subsp. enterica serovar Panama]
MPRLLMSGSAIPTPP